MRGGGVDDAGVRVVDQRDRFLGRFVRQAQESHVGGIDQALALGQILALVGVDLEHFDIAALGEVFVDLQAGGAFLAVDKDFVGHGDSAEWVESKFWQKSVTLWGCRSAPHFLLDRHQCRLGGARLRAWHRCAP
jgi:hypothetical protein